MMNKNTKNLPFWTRSSIMGGLIGMVVTCMKAGEFANPLFVILGLIVLTGSVIYSIR